MQEFVFNERKSSVNFKGKVNVRVNKTNCVTSGVKRFTGRKGSLGNFKCLLYRRV